MPNLKVDAFPRQMKEPMAAYYLSYSVGKFRQMWRDSSTGIPPPRREGRSTFWLKDDLDRWLDRAYQVDAVNDDNFEAFKARFAEP